MKVYESTNHSETYIPEKARALFKRQCALRKMHIVDEADIALEQCYKLYSKLFDQNLALAPLLSQTDEQMLTSGHQYEMETPETTLNEQRKKADPTDLTDDDFDGLITFWSK